MKLYCAGPMTGHEQFNFPAFDAARDRLIAAGHEVTSPADTDRANGWVVETGGQVLLHWTFDYDKALAEDFAHIAAADGLVLLDGWQASKGANLELGEARRLGKKIFVLEGDGLLPFREGGAALHPPDGVVLERAQALRQAETLTCGDRNVQYGDPLADFRRIAALWSVLFERTFAPHEVAMAMAALKLSRLCWSPGKFDSWVDLCGYGATGWECAVAEEKERAR